MRQSNDFSHVTMQDCSSTACLCENVLVRGYSETQELPREGVNVMVTGWAVSSTERSSAELSSKPESALWRYLNGEEKMVEMGEEVMATLV